MTQQRVRVSVFAHVYAWMFRLSLSLWPLALAAAGPRSALTWVQAVGLVIVIELAFQYARWRCSSERMSYWEGLLLISASMMTGWTYTSLLTVFPALVIAFLASLVLAAYADARGVPGYASHRFGRLVGAFHRNRMRG